MPGMHGERPINTKVNKTPSFRMGFPLFIPQLSAQALGIDGMTAQELISDING